VLRPAGRRANLGIMTGPERLDDSAKRRVKDALRAHAREWIDASGESVSDERTAAELDQGSSYSVDDLSQAEEAAELSGLLGHAREQQQVDLALIDHLDVSIKDVVVPGAVVAFGGDHYVVGVVAGSFECDGVTYEGISADSPIYLAIKGLRAGDTFSFHGHEQRLDLVC
jgi:hypothetical protein